MHPRIALISPQQGVISETFIKAHYDLLEGWKNWYHGGYLPYYDHRGSLASYLLPPLRAYAFLRQKTGTDKQLVARKAFEKSLIINQIGVILAEYGMTGAEVTPIARRLNIPLVVHFHGWDAYNRQILTAYSDRYRNMFAYASAIVAVSAHMEQQLLELGAPREKLIRNTYGPAERFFALSPDYQSCTFLALGRFTDKKAPYYTLAAFREVAQIYPEARLIMGGTGHLLPVCINLARYFGLSQKVDFLREVSHERVQQLMQQAFCFVQHSITADDGDREGTPVAILEAGAAALPVISTRHAGIADVVMENETGLLVDEHDVAGMAAHMCALFADRNRAHSLGSHARTRIREHFSMTQHIERLNTLLHQSFTEAKKR